RGPSATQTLGGGQVLQPVARKIRRRHFEILERIERLWSGTEEERVLTVAWFGGFGGFREADLVRGANVTPARARELIAQLHQQHRLTAIAVSSHRQVLLHNDLLSELEDRVLSVVG